MKILWGIFLSISAYSQDLAGYYNFLKSKNQAMLAVEMKEQICLSQRKPKVFCKQWSNVYREQLDKKKFEETIDAQKELDKKMEALFKKKEEGFNRFSKCISKAEKVKEIKKCQKEKEIYDAKIAKIEKEIRLLQAILKEQMKVEG